MPPRAKRRITAASAPPEPPEATAETPDTAEQPAEPSEPSPQEKRVEALRAEVQTVLDRFATHRFPLNYDTGDSVVALAARMALSVYVESGALNRDEVVERMLGAQLSILRQEFQERCIARDERALTAPRRPTDRLADIGRQVMMQRPRMIRPADPADDPADGEANAEG